MVDGLIEKALARTRTVNEKGQETGSLLDSLIQKTRDPKVLKDQILNVSPILSGNLAHTDLDTRSDPAGCVRPPAPHMSFVTDRFRSQSRHDHVHPLLRHLLARSRPKDPRQAARRSARNDR